MDSIYGGQPGQSFVLKGRFPSIAEMNAEFEKGSGYKDVWYGEYCIIDTKNKNHKDNGKIFRRGYNNLQQTNSLYPTGAIYVGRVVGPSSGTPYMSLTSLQDIQSNSASDKQETLNDEYAYFRSESNGSGTGLKVHKASGNNFQVPGKEKNGTYNDDIKWGWYNVRKDVVTNQNGDETSDNNEDSESWFHIGVEIPYPTSEWTSHSVSQYDSQGNYKTNSSKVDYIKPDGKEHPYHKDYELSIPKGIKGDSFGDLKIITVSDLNRYSVYQWSSFEYSISSTEEGTSINRDEGGVDYKDSRNKFLHLKSDGRRLTPSSSEFAKCGNDSKLLVYQISNFDRKKDGESYYVYLGLYKTIDKITVVDNNGRDYNYVENPDADTLRIYYTDQKVPVDFNHVLRRVKRQGISLDTKVKEASATSGRLSIPYTDGTSDNFNLQWLYNVNLDRNGTWTREYVGKNKEVSTHKIIWPINVYMNKDGKFFVQYNHDLSESEKNTLKENGPSGATYSFPKADTMCFQLNWIKNITFAENGTVDIYHADGKVDQKVNLITWMKNFSLNENDGQLQVAFNNNKLIQDVDKRLKWVKDLSVSDTGTVDITNTVSSASRRYENLLTWISGVQLNTSTGALDISTNNKKHELHTRLDWIKNVELVTFKTDKNGQPVYKLKAVKTTGKEDIVNSEKLFPHVDSVEFNRDKGTFIFTDTNNTSFSSEGGHKIDTLKDVIWDNETNQIKFRSYLNKLNCESDSLQYIDKIEYSSINYHVYVLFNYRPSRDKDVVSNVAPWNTMIKDTKSAWVKRNDGEWWIDLGCVKDESGIFVGKVFTLETVKTELGLNVDNMQNVDVVQKLNKKYPGGLPGDKHGKVVTVPFKCKEDDDYTSHLYAFDYTEVSNENPSSASKGTWICLGSLGGNDNSDKNSMVVSENEFLADNAESGEHQYHNRLTASGNILLTNNVNTASEQEASRILSNMYGLV